MIRFRHMQRILSEDYKRQDKLHCIRVNTGPANTLAMLISYHYKTNLKSFLNISCTPKHQTSYNLPRTHKEVFSHLRVHVCFHQLQKLHWKCYYKYKGVNTRLLSNSTPLLPYTLILFNKAGPPIKFNKD